MDLINIGTNLDKIDKINSLEIKQEVNKHATLKMTAVINKDFKDEYVREMNSGKSIEIFGLNKEGNFIKLFVGLIRNIKIRTITSVCYVEIQGVSTSFLADVKRKSQSFQDKEMLYSTIITKILKPLDGDSILNEQMQKMPIKHLIVQYQETDWELLIRLASHFNLGVLPDMRFEKPKLYFGVPEGSTIGVLEQYNYSIEKNIKAFEISKQNYNHGLMEMDSINFIVDCNGNFEIGDVITYQDVNLYIKNKEISLVEGSIRFFYTLSTYKGLTYDIIYNNRIVGVSLKGKVLKSVKDKVKVHMEIDKEQDETTAWEFPYATLYTAEGQSGFYCMPEKEDTVLIYFPECREYTAIGMNSIRQMNKDSDKTSDPNIKYFRTKYGKEVKFSSDEIVITCCNSKNDDTGEENIIIIKLNDGEGISLKSTKPIKLHSDASIEFIAKKNITISAKNEIKLNCKSSQIQLDSSIDIAGKSVKMN